MSMILKVAYVDYPHAVETKPGTGPGRNNVAWISDVEQVTIVGEFPCWEEIPAEFRHLTDLEIWAWRGYRREDFVTEDTSWYRPHTIVMIRTTNQQTRVLLVERAWLLNGDGDTIDTIAK
jgi:hypothetical protein